MRSNLESHRGCEQFHPLASLLFSPRRKTSSARYKTSVLLLCYLQHTVDESLKEFLTGSISLPRPLVPFLFPFPSRPPLSFFPFLFLLFFLLPVIPMNFADSLSQRRRGRIYALLIKTMAEILW